MAHSGGVQEWVIQVPSIPILVSVLFASLHLKYFRIKFLLLVCIVFMPMRTKPHSGGSGLSVDIHFVDLEVSYDVLSPLPIVLSKHSNHLIPT